MTRAMDVITRQIRQPILSISELNLVIFPTETGTIKTLYDQNVEHRKTIGKLNIENKI